MTLDALPAERPAADRAAVDVHKERSGAVVRAHQQPRHSATSRRMAAREIVVGSGDAHDGY